MKTLEKVWPVLKALAALAVAFAAAVVLLDVFGVIDAFDEEGKTGTTRGQSLPREFLYLDDERVDAYLGQLRGGLSASEARSRNVTRSREAKLGAQDVVQLGGSLSEQETISQTVLPRAADRYYMLETALADQFGQRGPDSLFTRVQADESRGCTRIGRPGAIDDGQFVRLTGARLRVPTYVLALAKVAHATPLVLPAQERKVGLSRERLSAFRERLSELARESRGPLGRYVKGFGRDPRLPFRLEIPSASGRPCEVLLPVRYSKITEAPSLLTGYITVVGKVARRFTKRDPAYFDLETAVLYQRALQATSPSVRRTLAVPGRLGPEVVRGSATATYPGLVVLPLAMYK